MGGTPQLQGFVPPPFAPTGAGGTVELFASIISSLKRANQMNEAKQEGALTTQLKDSETQYNALSEYAKAHPEDAEAASAVNAAKTQYEGMRQQVVAYHTKAISKKSPLHWFLQYMGVTPKAKEEGGAGPGAVKPPQAAPPPAPGASQAAPSPPAPQAGAVTAPPPPATGTPTAPSPTIAAPPASPIAPDLVAPGQPPPDASGGVRGAYAEQWRRYRDTQIQEQAVAGAKRQGDEGTREAEIQRRIAEASDKGDTKTVDQLSEAMRALHGQYPAQRPPLYHYSKYEQDAAARAGLALENRGSWTEEENQRFSDQLGQVGKESASAAEASRKQKTALADQERANAARARVQAKKVATAPPKVVKSTMFREMAKEVRLFETSLAGKSAGLTGSGTLDTAPEAKDLRAQLLRTYAQLRKAHPELPEITEDTIVSWVLASAAAEGAAPTIEPPPSAGGAMPQGWTPAPPPPAR